MIIVAEEAVPATPSVGKVVVYAKADGRLYFKDDAGTEYAAGVVFPISLAAGGTGGTSAITARAALGLVIGTDVQAFDAQLADVAGLSPTDNAVIIGNGTNFVVESGATLRTSLGLTIGTDVQAFDATLAAIAGLVGAANKAIYFTGADVAALMDISASGRSIANIAIAAKGDIITGTAAGTAGVTTVGANGKVLTADSTKAGGVDWTTPAGGGGGTTDNSINGFRLTLTTGVPVTVADVTAAETLYCCPYKSNQISLYDGAAWNVRSSAQFSIDVPDVTGVHDVFCYDNATVPTLEVLAWTNGTTRATALAYQDGVLVKSGTPTRRYIGTFYSTTAGNGQIEDSVANRYLWNYSNRVTKPMRVIDTTDTWTYTANAWRQANGNSANQLNVVRGLDEDEMSVTVTGAATNSSATVTPLQGVGLDSTTVLATGCINALTDSAAVSFRMSCSGFWEGYPGVGLHYLARLENPRAASGTVTWTGDNGSTGENQSGITGRILS